MSKVLSSIGVVHSIVTSATDTRPTTGYKKIPGVYENSEIDIDPGTIDTTSYDNLKYMSSIPGLIDTTGIQTLTANATKDEDAETVWDEAVDDYENNEKYVWLCVDIPDKTDCTFIPIVPIRTGAYNIALNDKISISLKYTIREDLEFGTRPTYVQA
jgi:hypothetical protein